MHAFTAISLYGHIYCTYYTRGSQQVMSPIFISCYLQVWYVKELQ